MEGYKSDIIRFTKTEEALVNIKDKWGGALESIFAKWEAYKVEQANHKKEYNDRIDSMCDELARLKFDADAHSRLTFDTFDFIQQKVSDTRKDAETKINAECQSLRKARAPGDNITKKMLQYKKDIVGDPHQVLDHVIDRLAAEKSRCDAAPIVMSSIKKAYMDSFVMCDTVAKNMKSTLNSEIKEIEGQVVPLLKADMEEISSLKKLSSTTVKLITDTEETTTRKLLEHMDEQCDFMSTNITVAAGGLNRTGGLVDEFWEETYQFDVRTGMTPMRRNFDFPSALSYPSPHSRVIARYRHRNVLKESNRLSSDGDSDMNSSTTSADSTIADSQPGNDCNDYGDVSMNDLFGDEDIENKDPRTSEGDAATVPSK